ncbi:hypothetical protein OG824_32065 [Streptomyces prunicolor]|uniref:hypothetical protein n=1 Tax=Streptomyces prunicolor TaxID=67348 RepID=UPI002252A9E9|nr:hypothetical protein [Streptomyces prunicolor]MCX5239848.1 hypothetical protein [Streptomyces prunicolor]
MTVESEYGPGQIVTQAERDLAVTHWLLAAARDRAQALAEWDKTGTTLLPCGGILAALGVPADLVHAAVGTTNTADIPGYLAAAFHGGPVIVDGRGGYYALVRPASGTQTRRLPARLTYFGRGLRLEVPQPGLTDPAQHGHAPYWAVPMDGPGDLCQVDAVIQLAIVGHYRQFKQGATQ